MRVECVKCGDVAHGKRRELGLRGWELRLLPPPSGQAQRSGVTQVEEVAVCPACR